MISKEQLQELTLQCIKDWEDVFLVDVSMKLQGSNSDLVVLLDGDGGIDVGRCGEVSRYLGDFIEENEMMDEKYRLEVSSPGIDHPLKLYRQYVKNIGRNLNITTFDGVMFKGKLLETMETGIVLRELKEEPKKANTYGEDRVEFRFDSIENARVLISFN
jgi:ribosome maturation factor RimP